jgi:hypothetical protein
MMAHQIWFWAKSCSGRFVRPVSCADRIQAQGLAALGAQPVPIRVPRSPDTDGLGP